MTEVEAGGLLDFCIDFLFTSIQNLFNNLSIQPIK